jgi:hypothetical protein
LKTILTALLFVSASFNSYCQGKVLENFEALAAQESLFLSNPVLTENGYRPGAMARSIVSARMDLVQQTTPLCVKEQNLSILKMQVFTAANQYSTANNTNVPASVDAILLNNFKCVKSNLPPQTVTKRDPGSRYLDLAILRKHKTIREEIALAAFSQSNFEAGLRASILKNMHPAYTKCVAANPELVKAWDTEAEAVVDEHNKSNYIYSYLSVIDEVTKWVNPSCSFYSK